MEVFLKRAEQPFKDKIGEEKTLLFFGNIKKLQTKSLRNFEEQLDQKFQNIYLISREILEM